MKTNILATVWLIAFLPEFASASDNGYWSQQKRGANFFNKNESSERFEVGKSFGLEFVRLAPSKWSASARDFLLGNADAYVKIPDDDLRHLRSILDEANSAGVKVLLTTLSVPGSRWRQQNQMEWDCRLYRESAYVAQVGRFWADLAGSIKDHPALAGIDPINEPIRTRCDSAVVELGDIYTSIVAAVRKVSPSIPIVIEADNFADARKFSTIPVFRDPNVLYSFHMYEPFDFTNLKINQRRYTYPGDIPMTEAPDDSWRRRQWNKEAVVEYLQPLIEWQGRNELPSSRILAGEFGCNRVVRGCEQYLSDLIDVFNEQGWHWAFYSFREDTWPGMDYELGTKPLTQAQWELIENGGSLQYPSSHSSLASMLQKKLGRLK